MNLLSTALITLPAAAAALTTVTGMRIRREAVAPRTGTALAALPGLTVVSVLIASICLAVFGGQAFAGMIFLSCVTGVLVIGACLAYALIVRAGATGLTLTCAALWAVSAWLVQAAFAV